MSYTHVGSIGSFDLKGSFIAKLQAENEETHNWTTNGLRSAKQFSMHWDNQKLCQLALGINFVVFSILSIALNCQEALKGLSEKEIDEMTFFVDAYREKLNIYTS
jgi:hypothetical protein